MSEAMTNERKKEGQISICEEVEKINVKDLKDGGDTDHSNGQQCAKSQFAHPIIESHE